MADIPKVTTDMEKCGPLLWTRLECAIEAKGENARGRIYFHSAETYLQQGPTCGFVALILAARAVGLEPEEKDQIDITDVIAWARMCQFTKGGEMFSAEWLSRIGKEFYHFGSFEPVSFPSVQDFIKEINEGKVFLIPYDCDKNFEPINRNGEGAHWAAIVGYFLHETSEGENSADNQMIKFEQKDSNSNVAENELFLIAYQGKSKHPALWKYSSLKESNLQLNIPDSRRSSSFQLPPKKNESDGELWDICGKAIRIYKK
uniref:Actin maturation protease n=1 Tax=Panagrolaimus davidi TaxID=227884 RepID=A0A914P911_9BILA